MQKFFSISLFTIILLLFCFPSFSIADSVRYRDWETNKYYYYEINNYSDLYSAFEDLENEHDRLIDEYNSLEEDYEELQKQLKSKEQEIKDLTVENSKSIGSTDDISNLLYSIFLIIVVPYGIYKIYTWLKQSN